MYKVLIAPFLLNRLEKISNACYVDTLAKFFEKKIAINWHFRDVIIKIIKITYKKNKG